jgi:hypothetical protein
MGCKTIVGEDSVGQARQAGLNDIAVDTVERFADRLTGRLDTEQAFRLLADPHCRPVGCGVFVRNARRSVRRRVRLAIGLTGRLHVQAKR